MASPSPFKKATLKNVRVKMGITGPSKAGKTIKSLFIGTSMLSVLRQHGSLVGNGRIAVIDSENESALKYADMFDFDHCPLGVNFSPDEYVKYLNMAVEHKYSLVIVDSISHEWAGSGGILEIHNNFTQNSPQKNSFTSWGKVTPKHNAFLDAIVRYPAHLIATIRSRTKYVAMKSSDGKMSDVRKVGLRPIQRKETEYEFDILGNATDDHLLTFGGTRCRYLSDRTFSMEQIEEVGTILGQWITETFDNDTMKVQPSQEVPQELIDEILAHKQTLRMSEKSWATFMSRYSVSTVERLTEKAAIDARNTLLAQIEKHKDKINV